MKEAFRLATLADQHNEVPVGAVVVYKGKIIGRGYNQPVSQSDPTAHAEIQALRDAAKAVNNYRLVDCDLYVTIEPCAMCAGAIVHSRIRKVWYGATEPKAGVVSSQGLFFQQPYLNHQVIVQGGILEKECGEIVQNFFQRRRKEKREKQLM